MGPTFPHCIGQALTLMIATQNLNIRKLNGFLHLHQDPNNTRYHDDDEGQTEENYRLCQWIGGKIEVNPVEIEYAHLSEVSSNGKRFMTCT